MKKLLLLSALLIFACSSDDSSNNDNNNDDNNDDINIPPTGCVSNDYQSIHWNPGALVSIEWTTENACHTTYRDGTPIPYVEDPNEWSSLTTGAWCYYDNDPSKGVLYNYYALAGIHSFESQLDYNLTKKFAPEGWHIPTVDDVESLLWWFFTNGYGCIDSDGYGDFYNNSANQLAKGMASKYGWNEDDTGNAQECAIIFNPQTNNSTGFNLTPSGIRETNGEFMFEGEFGVIWLEKEGAYNQQMYYQTMNTFRYQPNIYYSPYHTLAPGTSSGKMGFSVRLVKD